jgi:hypothetical protein
MTVERPRSEAELARLVDDGGNANSRLCTETRNRLEAKRRAQCRACFRSSEIRILELSGNVERTIAFDEANRRL